MDGLEQESWTARADRIRTVRRHEYSSIISGLAAKGISKSGAVPFQLYEIAAKNLRDLGLAWREVFQEYWKGAEHADPVAARDREIEIIGKFFDDELLRIDQEIAQQSAGDEHKPYPDLSKQAREQIIQARSEVRPECQALVTRLATAEQSRLRKESSERTLRWIELLAVSVLSALGGSCVALLSNNLGKETSAAQIKSYQQQTDALKVVADRLADRVTVLNRVSPPFAVVDADGKITYQEDRFKKYGLTVSVKKDPKSESNQWGWKYIFHFSRPPRVVLFFSQGGAEPSKKIISDQLIEVEFVSLGFGNPTVRSESIVQILEPSR